MFELLQLYFFSLSNQNIRMQKWLDIKTDSRRKLLQVFGCHFLVFLWNRLPNLIILLEWVLIYLHEAVTLKTTNTARSRSDVRVWLHFLNALLQKKPLRHPVSWTLTSTMPWLMVPYGLRRTSNKLMTITIAMATATTSSPTIAPRLNVSKTSGCCDRKQKRGNE